MIKKSASIENDLKSYEASGSSNSIANKQYGLDAAEKKNSKSGSSHHRFENDFDPSKTTTGGDYSINQTASGAVAHLSSSSSSSRSSSISAGKNQEESMKETISKLTEATYNQMNLGINFF